MELVESGKFLAFYFTSVITGFIVPWPSDPFYIPTIVLTS